MLLFRIKFIKNCLNQQVVLSSVFLIIKDIRRLGDNQCSESMVDKRSKGSYREGHEVDSHWWIRLSHIIRTNLLRFLTSDLSEELN